MTGGILPETVSFTHNGQPILAVLVEGNAPGAGDWTMNETCSICNQPLARHSFYATDPLLFYIHAHCIYYDFAATAAPPIDAAISANYTGTQSRRPVSQSRSILFCTPPQYYPSYITYNPSYSSPDTSAYPATTYYQAPSSPYYYYNQYHPPPPYNYSYHHYTKPATNHPSYTSNPSYTSQYDHYSQLPLPPSHSTHHPSSSSSSSSAAGWKALMATTVVGSFMQALFSLLLSGS